MMNVIFRIYYYYYWGCTSNYIIIIITKGCKGKGVVGVPLNVAFILELMNPGESSIMLIGKGIKLSPEQSKSH